jgi:hypothetical protein
MGCVVDVYIVAMNMAAPTGEQQVERLEQRDEAGEVQEWVLSALRVFVHH